MVSSSNTNLLINPDIKLKPSVPVHATPGYTMYVLQHASLYMYLSMLGYTMSLCTLR